MSKNLSDKLSKVLSRKIMVSALVFVVGLLSATSIFENLVDGILLKRLSVSTDRYLTDTMIKAGASYGALRGGNAIISVIQGTDVNVPGVSIAFGEVVDPINDILERTSSVMMLSLTSLGIQKIIVKLGSWISMTFLLSAAVFFLLAGIWFPGLFGEGGCHLLAAKLILIALLVYFFVPFAYYANNRIYEQFMAETYRSSVASVEDFNESLKQIQEEKADVEEGFWDKFNIKGKFLEMKQKLSDLQDRAGRLISDLINLAVVFALQTVLIPLLFLWLLVKLIGAILRIDSLEKFYTGPGGRHLCRGGR